MSIVATILIGLVALEHLYILYIEMFAWETIGRRVFSGALPEELFPKTKGLAANQGLYNGFLAAGLIWGFFIESAEWSANVHYFFLSCIIIAAVYGTWRSSRSILLKQGLPAILAMIALLISTLET